MDDKKSDAVAAEEASVTMVDVLEQENELEEECAAVLGGSDEKRCTYDDGPVKRQALYSCLTCLPDPGANFENAAAICLACSISCHENHKMVELYTKRNYRCDCPTERLANNRCVLNAALQLPKPNNTGNVYNHNFAGLYCICKRPYPDPENVNDESMIQCAICEDWYHLNHLGVPADANKLADMYSEMVCDTCMHRYAFLQDYAILALQVVEECEENEEIVPDLSITPEELDDDKLRSELDKSIAEIMNIGDTTAEEKPAEKEQNKTDDKVEVPNAVVKFNDVLEAKLGATGSTKNIDDIARKIVAEELKREIVIPDEPEAKKPKLEDDKGDAEEQECIRPDTCTYDKGATFWADHDLREVLCKCKKCLDLYKSLKVEFLTDKNDTAHSYEQRGKERSSTGTTTYERGIQALASIGHVEQVVVINEYNYMMVKLKQYLQTFAVNNRIVTEGDVNSFFEEMRKRKKPTNTPPNFCR